MDLLEPRSSRQTHQTSARLCQVDISTLPEITEETLPKWEDLKRYKIHSCYICGKRNMKLNRYNNHVYTAHQVDLEKPVFEEFDEARAFFECDLENATPDEMKTLYCDYDSEKEKRYSEIESEEESNSDDNVEKEEKKSNHPDILHQQIHQALHHQKAPQKVPRVNQRENEARENLHPRLQ